MWFLLMVLMIKDTIFLTSFLPSFLPGFTSWLPLPSLIN